MSLKSCDECGYALATLDDKCRHCSPSESLATLAHKVDARALLMIALFACALGVLLYRAFFH